MVDLSLSVLGQELDLNHWWQGASPTNPEDPSRPVLGVTVSIIPELLLVTLLFLKIKTFMAP